ncbi:MAG TPA: hypothetical protein VKC34_08000, partial [Blastocatellia bacterium]|nr:hypothetical protein [Blastocatellia bacterium]
MNAPKSFRSSSFFLGTVFLAFGVLLVASLDFGIAKSYQPTIRAVRLGGATLAPTTISANGTAEGGLAGSATLTVSVATSSDVVNGTIARVDLTEDLNPSGINYSVSGGQENNGRVWDVTLRGRGQAETIRYTISGNANSPGGTVQFRVNLRSATNPPNTPLPAAITEMPVTLTMGLALTFQRVTIGENGGGFECFECCNGENGFACSQCGGGGFGCLGSPIIIDTSGDGFDLTDVSKGVNFDLDS